MCARRRFDFWHAGFNVSQLRNHQRTVVTNIGTRGKVVAIYSPAREFVFGDGFFHNIAPPHIPLSNTNILAPLTPKAYRAYPIAIDRWICCLKDTSPNPALPCSWGRPRSRCTTQSESPPHRRDALARKQCVSRQPCVQTAAYMHQGEYRRKRCFGSRLAVAEPLDCL